MMINDDDFDGSSVDSSQFTKSDHCSVTTGGGERFKEEDDSGESIRKQISKQETRNVFRLRLLVILILVLIAIIISLVVYRLTTQAERDEFESQYEAAADKIVQSFEDIIVKLGSIAGLGMSFTSYGVDHREDNPWPFVTLNNFQQKAKHARLLSGALLVGVSPLVAGEEFDAWEAYVRQSEQQEWM